MNNTDTSELLPREDIARLLWRTPHDYYSFDNASPRAKAVVYAQSDAVIAYAKSRLQAEAPEDARKDEIEIAKHILGLIFPKANDADFAMFVERHGVHIAAIIRADRNAARTSQAEAQAPTTAASVLTEDERHIVQFVRNVVNGPCLSVIADHQARHLLRIIDRLTGAPAPAPTTGLISEAPSTTHHMNPILVYWRNVGWRESYWDYDEEFNDRPKGWPSPEQGWRSSGDACIPSNQDDATHFALMPAVPAKGDTP